MKLASPIAIGLFVLPALALARLRPHVRRQQTLANATLVDSGLSLKECNTGSSRQTPRAQTKNPVLGHLPGGSVFRGDPPLHSNGLLAANTKYPGFLFGAAVHSSYLDGSFDECILPNFNMLVPEYEAKSDKIHPQRDQWNTQPVDLIVSYTKKHNMAFRLHTLFFDQTMSPIFASLAGNAAGLKQAMTDLIQGVMTRFGDVAFQVDVVNEIMAYDGKGEQKHDVFYNTLQADYLPFAFNTVKKANAKPILFLNDNDVEGYHVKGLESKYEGLIRVIKDLQAKKVSIDAVGLECHFQTGSVPKELPNVIGQLVSMGLKVMITELDMINSNGQDVQQAADFTFVIESCLKHFPSCMGVNFWGVNDAVSWLGEGSHGTLFDKDCKSKGLDHGIRALLNGTVLPK